VGFDPRLERIVGTPAPVLASTQPIRDHELSPDGQWVALMLTGTQEDVAIARLDGGEYRRLTDDRFRDRNPTWSPDGKEIAFCSDRGGTLQIWSIHADGSGLREIVSAAGGANIPVYAPDGRRMAIATLRRQGGQVPFGLADLRPAGPSVPARSVPTPELGDAAFWPGSWSADGKRLVGAVLRKDGTAGVVAVHDLESGRTRAVFEGEGFVDAIWLPDSRRVLVRDRRGISLLDPATKSVKLLVEVGGTYIGKSVGISRDDRWITYTETGTEGDVWVAELQ
jgi:Tol biopolymer transport system component